MNEPQWVDTSISNLLRGGVLLSIATVILGLLFTFVHHPEYVSSKTDLRELTDARTVYPHAIREVVAQTRAHRGQAIVMLGLLLLIATPIARVAFSVAAFIVERDRVYVCITIAVLALLLFSLAIGAT
jgi:uncharacterized membrane protein